MASGPVSRTDRPNTWLLRPALRRDRSLDNPEPSTHGPSRTSREPLLSPSRFATNMAHRREAEPPDMLGLDVDAVALPGRRLPLLKALRWNP
jgi:hypothetical protein